MDGDRAGRFLLPCHLSLLATSLEARPTAASCLYALGHQAVARGGLIQRWQQQRKGCYSPSTAGCHRSLPCPSCPQPLKPGHYRDHGTPPHCKCRSRTVETTEQSSMGNAGQLPPVLLTGWAPGVVAATLRMCHTTSLF